MFGEKVALRKVLFPSAYCVSLLSLREKMHLFEQVNLRTLIGSPLLSDRFIQKCKNKSALYESKKHLFIFSLELVEM